MTKTKWCGLWLAVMAGAAGAQVLPAALDETPASPVALTMKHFPGGGPQELGLDPHYAFGKNQVYPSGNFGSILINGTEAIR